MHIQDTLSFCLSPQLGAVWDGRWRRGSTNKKKIFPLWFLYHLGCFLLFYRNKLHTFNGMQYWSHGESPKPLISIDMNMKHCTTDYGMNLENHYSQVPVFCFVEHIEVAPFSNEMTCAIIGRLFGPESFSNSSCGKMEIRKGHRECTYSVLRYGITEISRAPWGHSRHLFLVSERSWPMLLWWDPVMSSFRASLYFTIMDCFLTWQLFPLNVTSLLVTNKEFCSYPIVTNPSHYCYILSIDSL